ncbi:MAG: DUF5317 family protein [Coriobacteriia bacterium]|jgi:hypothetical protein|nr:DUF5317 family protein [Coriobacteriia bacterium]
MSLLLLGVLLGGLLGLITGGTVHNIAAYRLRGEGVLLLSLIAQSAAPVISVLTTMATQPKVLVYALWAPCAIVAMCVTAINLRRAGMWMALVGLMSNLLVVLANGGMPVLGRNAELVDAGITAIEEGISSSWLHVPADASTHLLFLSDVFPVSIPIGQSLMLSLGDILLATGLALYLFAAAHSDFDGEAAHSALR